MDLFAVNLQESAGLSSTPQGKIGQSTANLDALRRELDRQRLLIEVLIRALVDKKLYTREQLNALANLVDMEDGYRDGRLRPPKGIKTCSNCGRTMMNKMGTCLYCGHQEVIDIV